MANLTEHTYNDLPIGSQLTIAKVLAMVVLGLGSLFLGLAPLKMTKCWRKKSFSPSIDGDHHHHHHHHHQHHHSHPGDSASNSPMVSRLLCFGGGVLLSTTLLHLQPEVREVVSRLQHAELLPETENLGDLLFCAGFFMVFLVDELAHTVLNWFYSSGRRTRCADENALRQSMSLRRRSRSVSSQVEPTSLDGCSDRENGAQKEKEESSSRDQLDRYRRHHHHDYQYSVQFHPNGDDVEKQRQQVVFETGSSYNDHSLHGLFTVLALSFHEIFEGMAIGLEERVDHVWYLFIAVATHKLVIAFCIGLELAWSGTRRFMLIVYVATFAVVTPVGIAFGMVIMHYGGTVGGKDGSPGPIAAVLQGLAAGTLLYVVFFEVLARHKQSGWAHLLSVVFGFGVLLALQMMTHHHHGHEGHDQGDHGHDHINSHAHNHEHGKDHDHEHSH